MILVLLVRLDGFKEISCAQLRLFLILFFLIVAFGNYRSFSILFLHQNFATNATIPHRLRLLIHT